MSVRKSPKTHLTDLTLLQREVSQLLERLSEFDRADRTEAGEWCPTVDVYECRGSLVVVVELPGLLADSLKVAFKDRNLVVSGERKEPRRGEATFLCVERPQGRFSRTIPLDNVAVDVQKAEAELGSGLLKITLPRLKDRRGRETVIPVRKEGGS